MVSVLPAAESSGSPAQPITPEYIADQVQQLGAGSFTARERASQNLAQLGLAAKPALEAAIKDPDAEIRLRAKRILAVVRELDRRARLEAFLADANPEDDHGLPGWLRFRKDVGHGAAARQLFGQMQQAEGELMERVAASPDFAPQIISERCLNMQAAQVFSTGGSTNALSLGSLAALFFLGSDPELKLDDQSFNLMSNFAHQPAMQQALSSGPYMAEVRRVAGLWITSSASRPNNYASLVLAINNNLAEGLLPALAMIKQPGMQPHQAQQALLVIGRFGNRSHLKDLEPLFKRADVMYRQNQNGQMVTLQLRDVALAISIHLSGQKPADFGMPRAQLQSQTLFNPISLGFKDDAERDAAFKKWEQWRAAQPSEPASPEKP